MKSEDKNGEAKVINLGNPLSKLKPTFSLHFRETNKIWRWTVAASLTTLVHALVIVPMLGTCSHNQVMPFHEATDISNQSAVEVTSVLLLLKDRSEEQVDDSPYSTVPLAEETKDLVQRLVAIATPRISISRQIDSEDNKSLTIDGNGDTGQAMLFGRYVGQIKARIERAWIYPGEGPDGFQCKVRISQTKEGNVTEVTLQSCDQDPYWQLSIVHAIQSASPLPAPPNETVFSNVITLRFDAEKIHSTAEQKL